MIGLGTIVNAVSIVAGGMAGTFVKNGLSQRFKQTVIQAIGLSVLIIGVSGTLSGLGKQIKGESTDRTMLMILSLVIGGVAGELINIEEKLERMGNWFQRKLVKGESTFAQGFITASLIYCVGAMAIVGSLEDGLTGSTSTLFAKSVLDGVSAVIFAATMGIGVAFSALPILIYQGGITLLAGLIKPWLTDSVINQMSLVGSALIMAIGINILEIKRIKVGNMLPAIFIPFIYYLATCLFR
ncbi:MAG: DUF554 domain-containing protein [Clostridia bacterium]|nr:DUF554 domain-containing protein [Clostridia bacterium]